MAKSLFTSKISAVSLGVFFSALAFAHKTEIAVYPFSEVTAGRPVRLYHVAGPVHEGPSRFDEIQDTELLPARGAGERFFLGRIEVARILQEKISSEEFTFKIPNQVLIESKKNYVSKQDVSRKILEAAAQTCGDCSVHLRDLKIPVFTGITETMSAWSLDLSNVKLQGSFMVPLNVELPSGSQTFWVTGYADFSKLALVARRQISPGERLSENDFEEKMVSVTFQKGSLLKESEIKGQQSARYLVVGQPFVAGDIRKEAAAVRGQIIKVMAGDDGMEISLQAIAEDTGFVGDLIKLKNTETQKMISGKIIEKGVVRLQ